MSEAQPPEPQPQDSTAVAGLVQTPRQPLVASKSVEAELSLMAVSVEEFLPSVRPWIRLAAWLVVGGFGVGVGLLAVWPYRVVVRGPGVARPSGETGLVNAPRDGRVRAILVRPDATVKRGQVIAVLDPADLVGRQLKLGQDTTALERQRSSRNQEALAAVQGAELEVDKARAALAFAQSEYDRYRLLLGNGAGSLQQMEEKKANLSVARATLAKAGREVAELRSRNVGELARISQQLSENRAERAQLGRDLGRTSVRSPVDGVVLSLALRNPMQEVVAGQELARIARRDQGLLVKVQVPSVDIAEVAVGQRADLRVSACPYPDFGTLPAKVMSIAPDTLPPGSAQAGDIAGTTGEQAIASAGQATGGYTVTLKPDRSVLQTATRRCAVKPGMDLRADITTRQEPVLRFLLRKVRLFIGQ